MLSSLPIWIKVRIADGIPLAKDLCIGVYDIDKISITALNSAQTFSLIEAGIRWIQSRDARYRLIGQKLELASSSSDNVCSQAVSCVRESC